MEDGRRWAARDWCKYQKLRWQIGCQRRFVAHHSSGIATVTQGSFSGRLLRPPSDGLTRERRLPIACI